MILVSYFFLLFPFLSCALLKRKGEDFEQEYDESMIEKAQKIHKVDQQVLNLKPHLQPINDSHILSQILQFSPLLRAKFRQISHTGKSFVDESAPYQSLLALN